MTTARGVADTARQIAAGELTALQAVDECLAAIDGRDPELNAFSVVLAERARAEAAERDGAAQPIGPLHGVPIAIKEENDVEGCVTTFGGTSNSTCRGVRQARAVHPPGLPARLLGAAPGRRLGAATD